jgi:predicted patatin/cPLA2 family phospholipase
MGEPNQQILVPEGLVRKTALVLSAGGPTAPLIAGVLHAFYEKGVRFPIIYTSGGSALVGLMLVAPRVPVSDAKAFGPKSDGIAARLAALKSLPEHLAVADQIYRHVPLGYKAFFKPGPYTPLFRSWAHNFKFNGERTAGSSHLGQLKARAERWLDASAPDRAGALKRLYNDWIDLVTALMTPSPLTPASQGLCAPFPFIEELVDFDLLKRWHGKIYMPAYDLTEHKLVQFTNKPQRSSPSSEHEERMLKGPDEFRACFAAPFVYPPVKIDGHFYTEGAFHDPDNVDGWLPKLTSHEIDHVFLLDTLGTQEMIEILLRPPTGLRDAFGLSIMTAAVAAAKANAKLVKERSERLGKQVRIHEFEWGEIPKQLHPTFTEWSHSNLSALFELGRLRGGQYLDKTVKKHDEELANDWKGRAGKPHVSVKDVVNPARQIWDIWGRRRHTTGEYAEAGVPATSSG